MENFLAPNLIGIVIQTAGTIIVALITRSSTAKRVKKRKRLKKTTQSWMAAGASGVITFVIIGLVYNLATRPSVAISTPAMGESIEVLVVDTGSGSFPVSGTSSRVYSQPELRLYVLVHPDQPHASGWWIQESATVQRNGEWSTLAWYGSADFPPQSGNRIDLLALVADPKDVAGRTQIADPKDVEPSAQSDIINVTIGETN